ncbi:hypothetical protein RRSWK_05175 [Rhodopirellula sp. SWK7]|nr:hypothetical protein RRSWK_05175 [Rhodopirellula sp. SWK7]
MHSLSPSPSWKTDRSFATRANSTLPTDKSRNRCARSPVHIDFAFDGSLI